MKEITELQERAESERKKRGHKNPRDLYNACSFYTRFCSFG